MSSNLILNPECVTFYKKRVCVAFVEDDKKCVACAKSRGEHDHMDHEFKSKCSGCKRIKEDHLTLHGEAKWDYEKCTVTQVTDAYGEKQLSPLNNRESKYVRIANTTEPSDFIQYMYSKNGWELRIPKLILSVTGGAQNFRVNTRLKKAFKRGLMSAAISTNAWIITGGSNMGVMKLVGEAVAEESHKHNLTVIGVATWGRVLNRNLFKIDNKSAVIPQCSLDPNHTHFILVDDGSEEAFGKEIAFRAKLEKELRRGKSLNYYSERRNSITNEQADEVTIPMVLIVLNGGPNTLKTVIQSIALKVPVLILEGSGGCADVIAQATVKKNPNLDDLVEHFEAKKPDEIKDDLKELIQLFHSNESLFNVFTLDNEEGEDNFEDAILRTFLKSQLNSYDKNLCLSLRWNRVDVARDYIFTGEEKLSQPILENLMQCALIHNNIDFVSLFLDNSIVLDKFLTLKRLQELYNSERSCLHEAFELLNIIKDKQMIRFEHLDKFFCRKLHLEFELFPKDKFFETEPEKLPKIVN